MARFGSWWVLPLFTAAAVCATWPLILRFDSAIPSTAHHFDPPVQAFLLGWDWNALRGAPLQIFNVPIFHPEPRTLAYMDHLIGETLLAAPVLAITGSVAAGYNFVVLISFVASAWGVYRLVRLFGAARAVAALCGFLFAFGPYRWANLDLLNQLQTQLLPIGLFYATRYLMRQRPRDLVGVAAAMAAQIYFGWYYSIYLFLALALLLTYAVIANAIRLDQIPARWVVPLVACVLALALPVAIPYLVQGFSIPGFRRTLGQAALYSADVLDYVKSPESSWMSQWIPLPTGAQSYFPGLTAAALGVAGAWRVLRPRADGALRLARYFFWLAAAGFVFSLGPVLHVAGARIWIPLPYAVLYYLVPPLAALRAPARLACLVLLAVVVLAGIGMEAWRRRLLGNGARWPLAIGAVALLAAATSWIRPINLLELPRRETLPPVYAWLSDRPGKPPVLEIPVAARDADEDEAYALRQYYALFHGKPRLDGASGFVSPAYREFRRVAQSFPDPPALDAARDLGARLVVVHYGDLKPEERAGIAARVGAEPRLTRLATFGDDAVFALQPP